MNEALTGKAFAIQVCQRIAAETIFTEEEASKIMRSCSPRYVFQAARIADQNAGRKELIYYLAIGGMATLQRDKDLFPSIQDAWEQIGIQINHPCVLRGVVAGLRLLH
jgi:hypothetical protein